MLNIFTLFLCQNYLRRWQFKHYHLDIHPLNRPSRESMTLLHKLDHGTNSAIMCSTGYWRAMSFSRHLALAVNHHTTSLFSISSSTNHHTTHPVQPSLTRKLLLYQLRGPKNQIWNASLQTVSPAAQTGRHSSTSGKGNSSATKTLRAESVSQND